MPWHEWAQANWFLLALNNRWCSKVKLDFEKEPSRLDDQKKFNGKLEMLILYFR